MLKLHREYFGNTREPFTITVAGSQIHILTDPKDLAVAYKNSSTLSFDGFVQAMMRTFGSSKYCVRAMYNYVPHSLQENDFPNPQYKPLAKLSRDLHIKQLHPGEHLNDLGKKFESFLQKTLVLEEVAKNTMPVKRHQSLSSFLYWCGARKYPSSVGREPTSVVFWRKSIRIWYGNFSSLTSWAGR